MGRAILAAMLLLCASGSSAQPPAQPEPSDEDLSIQALFQALETAISTTDRAAWLSLLSEGADRDQALEFFDAMVPQGVTRAVIRERERAPLAGVLPGDGYRLVAEVFLETGPRGRVATWRLDIRRPRGEVTERQPWRILSEDRLSSIEGLHRLTLHPEKQFAARDLTIRSVDFELRLPEGDVFIAETAEGTTGMVLLGEGTMVFSPTPKEERGQVRLFAGADAIETAFTAAYIRVSPFELDQRVTEDALSPVPVDSRVFRRAREIFDEEVMKSFSLDLTDMSRDTWSLLPQAGDFLAEVRTRRFDTLTFARSTGEAEDVSMFHRGRKRNISIYASEQKLASRGRFYNEDDLVEYDILDYNIDATFSPEREWLDGRARLKLRVKAYALAALTLRLADTFTVNSIMSDQLGRLLFLKVRNQNSVVVNLPAPVARDLELTLVISYQGRIQKQSVQEESIQQGGGRSPQRPDDMPLVPPEANWLLSNRNQWYPQGQVSDYATATIRVTVPSDLAVVGTGEKVPGSPVIVSPGVGNQPGRAVYVFTARQPVRYLGVVISRFTQVDAATVALDIVPETRPETRTTGREVSTTTAFGSRNTLQLTVEANRRQEQRGRDALVTAADILRTYSSLVGDVPYESVTLAMVEHDLPGGHSPAYFAVINNPLPTTPFVWRNDPATFSNFPEFFIAHELAHQWWGQAIGWKNYHEQWLSEGFAQYFAALFARERRGEPAFREVLRQFRRWSLDQSDQGAIYLGYRLGHIKNDSRVFRALVYNKGAGVIHMLRRFVGDEAFFKGLKRFYAANRFKKAGTDDLQKAFEAESGRSLDRFFQRWIYESALPRLRVSSSIDGQTVIARAEQSPEVFDVPITISVTLADGRVHEEVMIVSDTSVEKRIAVAGPVRNVEFNVDNAALAIIEKR
jgi:hypothetical protein